MKDLLKSVLSQMKAWSERDHRLQLQQLAAMMKAITRSGANSAGTELRPPSRATSTSPPSNGAPISHSKVMYRKKRGSAPHNLNFSSNGRLTAFVSFSILVLSFFFLFKAMVFMQACTAQQVTPAESKLCHMRTTSGLL